MYCLQIVDGAFEQVAKLVLSALEPQLKNQQSEISRLSNIVKKSRFSINISCAMNVKELLYFLLSSRICTRVYA